MIKRTFTVSIPVTGSTSQFPNTLAFDGRNVYGIIGHRNKENNRKNVTQKELLHNEANAFVTLEGVERCETSLLQFPLDGLFLEFKPFVYVPLSIGVLNKANCKIEIGNYNEARDAGKVVMLTFITD